jgi:tRNA(Ile)-lysidine synthase
MNAAEDPLVLSLLARCPAFLAGKSVTCAVSGGADSTALLILAAGAGCIVHVIHVDHGLRPDSHLDSQFVAALATRFGATFQAEKITIDGSANVEARARDARWAVLGDQALTGHTADDQAETVLINILRGGSTDGLSGMATHRHPLLALRRSETRDLCRTFDINPLDDPTNHQPIYLRNRVRHELLPLMNELSRRDIVPLLTRQAALLRDDADLLNEYAKALDPTDARALATAPIALARRAIRLWLSTTHPPDLATVERVLAVARGEVQACETNDGRRVSRHQQRLSLEGSDRR